jgi:hypothetical protein
VPALPALAAFLIASAVAIGYACVRDLTLIRRVTVCLLALTLECNAALLIMVPHADVAYAVGIPCLLALGVIVAAPRRRTRAVASGPIGRPARAASSTVARHHPGHQTPHRGVPVLADPWAALYASMAGHVAHPTAGVGGVATTGVRSRGRRATERRAIDRRATYRHAANRRATGRARRAGPASRSFSRSWRCKCR